MKRLILALIFFTSVKAYSQANFSRIGIGATAGVTAAYTGLTFGLSDLPGLAGFNAKKGITTNKSKVFGGSLDYYFTPFITGGIEYNIVQLKDGPDKHNRAFISDFSSIEVRGNVAVGQFIDYSYSPFLYAIRNINAGLGIGFISGKNNVAEFPLGTDASTPTSLTVPYPRRTHIDDRGKSKFSSVVSLPISIGYNLNIYDAYQEVRFVIGANYKMVFTSSDDLDGFADDPTMFENNAKDVYTTYGISVKYLFGPKGLFFK